MPDRFIRRDGFFAFFEDIGPPGEGFVLFSPLHLAIMISTVIFVAAACILYKRAGSGARRKTLIALAVSVLVLDIIKHLSFPILHGVYFPFLLPFHLCRMATVVTLIHAFRPNKMTGELLYALFLPGALAAIIFNNWSDYPVLNYYFIHSTYFHTVHLAFAFMIIISGEFRPSIKNLWKPVAFLAIVVPFLYWFNLQFGTNFFFLNAAAEGSPLEFFVYLVGVPWFIIPYAMTVAVVWLLMYIPWHIADRRALKYASADDEQEYDECMAKAATFVKDEENPLENVE